MALKFLHSLVRGSYSEQRDPEHLWPYRWCWLGISIWGDMWVEAADVRRAELEHWIHIKGKVLKLQLGKKSLKDVKFWRPLCKDNENEA